MRLGIWPSLGLVFSALVLGIAGDMILLLGALVTIQCEPAAPVSNALRAFVLQFTGPIRMDFPLKRGEKRSLKSRIPRIGPKPSAPKARRNIQRSLTNVTWDTLVSLLVVPHPNSYKLWDGAPYTAFPSRRPFERKQ